MRGRQRTDTERGLIVWSVVIGSLSLLLTIGPIWFVRAYAGHQTTAGAGLGEFGLTLLVLSFVAPAPVLLAGLWLGGYGFWRARLVARGNRSSWSVAKIIVYLGLAVLVVYVLAFSAWKVLLGS